MRPSHQYPKTIMVTGAAGGIGQEIIKKLIAEEIEVIATDINIEKIKSQNNLTHLEKCDISDPVQIESLWKTLPIKNIVVDGLINNAGIFLACNWQKYTTELVHQVINTNLLGPFFMSQAFANQTKQGVIVNISSVSAFTGSSDPIYGTSKAGLIGLTKSLAINLAPKIRVNAIAPIITNTEMMKTILPEVLEKYQEGELLPECLEPEAVADAVMFLVSSRSKHITGSTLDINNGVYLR